MLLINRLDIIRIFVKIKIRMTSKLTLSIDKELVPKAKAYARKTGRSLSDLVESYLRSIVSVSQGSTEFSPIVRSLKGSFRLPKDIDYREEIRAAIAEKHE